MALKIQASGKYNLELPTSNSRIIDAIRIIAQYESPGTVQRSEYVADPYKIPGIRPALIWDLMGRFGGDTGRALNAFDRREITDVECRDGTLLTYKKFAAKISDAKKLPYTCIALIIDYLSYFPDENFPTFDRYQNMDPYLFAMIERYRGHFVADSTFETNLHLIQENKLAGVLAAKILNGGNFNQDPQHVLMRTLFHTYYTVCKKLNLDICIKPAAKYLGQILDSGTYTPDEFNGMCLNIS